MLIVSNLLTASYILLIASFLHIIYIPLCFYDNQVCLQDFNLFSQIGKCLLRNNAKQIVFG